MLNVYSNFFWSNFLPWWVVMYLVHVFHLGTYCTGVSSVRVALLNEKADIQYDPETMDPDTLVNEIKGLGFGAQLIGDAQGPDEGEVDLVVRIEK